MSDTIIAGMATIPSRAKLCRRIVERILPEVDLLYLSFNKYKELPGWAIKHPKIKSYYLPNNYLKDTSKMRPLCHGKDFWFVGLDDDLVYPNHYVRKMIDSAKRVDGVAGLHGIRLSFPFKNYRRDRKVIGFPQEVTKDTQVDALGTGTVVFYHSGPKVVLRRMYKSFGVDLPFAKWCRDNGKKMYCVERPANWVTQRGPISSSMWWDVRDNRKTQRRMELYISRNLAK